MRWIALVCVFLLLAAGIGERTDHFNIKYDDMKYLKPGTGKVLEGAYKTVNGYFGNLPKSIKVVVVDGDKMDEVGKHVEAFSAWNHDTCSIVLRGETLKDQDALGVVAKHEICHLALNSLLEKKDGDGFRWMEEGTCMVISDEPLDDAKISKYIVKTGFLDTDQIADAVDSQNYSVCKNGYLQSFSLCKYISQKYGKETLADMVKNPKKSFRDSFRASTKGANFDQLYADWKKQVGERADGSTPVQVVTVKGYLDLGMEEV